MDPPSAGSGSSEGEDRPSGPGDRHPHRHGPARGWTAIDAGKVAVPVVVGTLAVSVPYLLSVLWVTDALLDVVHALSPPTAFGIVVFLTLTTFSSFLFSAVMLVDRLLPWESPLAL